MPSPFPCSPLIHEWLWKKTQIEKKVTYSLLGKALEKQRKTNEDQGRKQVEAITNQNKRLTTLTNKDDHKDSYKKYLKN